MVSEHNMMREAQSTCNSIYCDAPQAAGATSGGARCVPKSCCALLTSCALGTVGHEQAAMQWCLHCTFPATGMVHAAQEVASLHTRCGMVGRAGRVAAWAAMPRSQQGSRRRCAAGVARVDLLPQRHHKWP